MLNSMEDEKMKNTTTVKCANCGELFDSRVDVSPDNPEIAYNNPISHGLCPGCNTPFTEKDKITWEEQIELTRAADDNIGP